jgi:hypothetical protein
MPAKSDWGAPVAPAPAGDDLEHADIMLDKLTPHFMGKVTVRGQTNYLL